MLAGDSAPGGFVAIPGSPLLDENPDTVAVVCMSRALGIEFPDNQEHEVLARSLTGELIQYNSVKLWEANIQQSCWGGGDNARFNLPGPN